MNILCTSLNKKTRDSCWAVRRHTICYVVSLLVWTGCTGITARAQCGASDVGGVVFREYKVDGVMDSGIASRERDIPLAGVTVIVYDVDSVPVGTNITDSTGAWSVDVSSVGVQPVLVEFGLRDSFVSGPTGSDNSSSVVVANPGDCTVNFTQSSICDHCEDVPTVVTACFPDPQGGFGDPTIVQVSWDDAETYSGNQNYYPPPDGTQVASKTTLASANDTFGVAGLAWNRTSGQVISGVYHKWGLTINQGHMGELYATTVSNSTTALWLDLEDFLGDGIAGEFGAVDAANRQKVGYIGFTDVEISAENDELYVYNAATREVFVIPINPDGSHGVTVASDIERFQIPEICSGSNSFGFVATVAGGLGVHNGRVYATATCTGPGTANLQGRMYSFDPDDNPTAAVVQAEITIDYSDFTLAPRTIGGDTCCGCDAATAIFTDWVADHGHQDYAPWMFDVDFDEDIAGNVYATIGTRNRGNETIDPAVLTVDPTVGSYLHRAFLNTNGIWSLETNGVVGTLTTGLNPSFTGNGSGCPGFTVNIFDRGPNDNTRFFHNEGLEGAAMQGFLASIPGFHQVVGPSTDNLFGNFDSGFSFHSLTNGLLARRVNLIGNGAVGQTWGKGTAWGDVEHLCELPPLEVGNLVWMDQDGDGLYEPNEPPIVGATVTLYEDLDGDGQIGVGEPVVATNVTDGSGNYFFTQADDGLKPFTDYIVTLETLSDFAPSGPLEGTVPSMANNPASENRDSDGELLNTGFAGTSFNTGPSGNNNHAYDFGMVIAPLSLGDTVWFDVNNDGTNDVAETGISNVVVELFASGLTPGVDAPTASTVTDTNGNYLFDSLLSGDFVVYLPATNFTAAGALAGFDSSTGNGIAPDPDDDANDDDNGDPEGNGGIVSLPVTLLEDNEPITDGDADTNTNLSVDFGLYVPLSLGDTVWFDENNNGTNDVTEGGISNVVVELYATNQTPGVDSPLASTLTDTNGQYSFSNLLPNDYAVYLPSTNFSAGAPLETLLSSSGNGVAPDPDDDVNDDDNGEPDLNGGILAQPVTLSVFAEPTDDGDSDANSNLGVDFGLYQPMSLGDTVWFDENNNGTNDVGEAGISNVVVELYRDGDTPGTDNPLATDATDASGTYLFDDLLPGDYVVYVPSTNFVVGAPLEDLLSSTGNGAAPDPDDDANDDDNGDPDGSGGLVSQSVTLSVDGEPTDDGDADPNSNLSVDFGLYKPMSLGNIVWFDGNNSGDLDGAEVGIDGVTVSLFVADGSGSPTGSVLQTDMTAGGGYYLFDDLVPGDYVVVVDATNFASGQVLDLHATSTGSAEEADPDSNGDSNDNGLNTSDPLVDGVLSAAVTLSVDGEPPSETDLGPEGDGLVVTPENSNLTVDFGFFIPVSVGDTIFFDENNNGTNDVAEVGISNVVVELYGTNQTPSVDSPLASMLTDTTGNYLFSNLLPDTYIVYLPSTNFTSGAPLETLLSSTGNGVAPDPDDDANDDDNGEPDGNGGVVAQPVTLAGNGEPTDDGDTNPNTNLSVDMGFYQPMSLGDTVWFDEDNNGTNDVGEAGISNVVVELYAAGDTPGVDTPLATDLTDSTGNYLFGDLASGDYVVYVPSTNFVAGAPLENLLSSTGNGTAPDPDDDANGDDNGSDDGSGGIASLPVTLSPNTEPTDDGDTDSNSNLSVDFGVYKPMSLGNIVWFDGNNSGDLDGAEVGIDGVTVSLFTAGISGAPTGSVLQMDMTAGGGYYLFDDLVPGDYVVVVDATNFASGQVLDLHATSTGSAEEADPDSNGDSNDNGLNTSDPLVDGVLSAAVTLSVDGEPPSETDLGPEGDGLVVTPENSNLTVDFGFFIPVSVGDTIFFDENNNGTNDVAEVGISNVVVELYGTNQTPSVDSPLASMLTDTTGNYLFSNLVPNTYIVYLPSTNFTFGAPLETLLSSTGNGVAPDPDDDANDDDNGEPDGNGGVVAQPVTLAGNGEPTDDGDTNPNTNLSVDMGFYQPMSLGDTVWFDEDNNGTNDVGEAGISNVVVELYADGDTPGVDIPLATDLTDSTGNYLFGDLAAGDYVVYVPSTNFVAGAPLENLLSSTGNGTAPDPDDDRDGDDNGDDDGSGGLVSSPVTLSPNSEPTDDGDTDPNSNLSVDFGVYKPMSLGNLVWFDENNSGNLDGAEVGIDGVAVSLFTAGTSGAPTGSVLQTDTTGGGGYYLFDDLVPGEYVVVVDAANFATGQVLELHATSTGASEEADPDSDGDSNDNGLNTSDPLVDGVLSAAVTLSVDGESPSETDLGPEGDGMVVTPENSNLTVDFGFFIPVSVGDTIFFDENNNGTNDVGEAGISNVVVELYVDGDTPGTDAPLATDTTDINGNYLFEGLNPGDYIVYVPSVNFDPGMPLETYNNSTGNGVAPDPDDDANDDDNGEPDGSDGVVAQVVSLASNGEPTDDGDTNPNSNLSVDIGFYQPMSLGDTVWFDENNNGTNDVIEVGISNVVVELYADSDTPGTDAPLAMDTTDGSGTYLFEDLVPGDYVVYVPSTNFVVGAPLEDLLSSTGNGVAPDPDDDVSDDDNGDPDGSGGLVSQAVTLSVDGEPIDDGDVDPNSNLSVDFGLYKPMSLGNLVWFDENNSGDLDGAEVGIDGVAVSLFTAGTSGAPTGSVLQTDTTGGGGYYLFDDLVPGEYVVVVDAANFATGQVLELHATSTGASEEADPDSDGDSNDNGLNTTDPLVAGVLSAAVTLSVDGESPSETDLGPEGDGMVVTPENSNLTVDFGFFIPVSVGDTIFFDENNNGTNDVGETGISNVVVELYPAGAAPGADMPLTADTTDVNGNYLFDGLTPGDYIVYVPSTNFGSGAPLETYNNSTGNGVAPDPDDDVNDDDNGEPDGSGGVVAQAVSLASNSEPTDDGDTDPNSNLSVDIGFFQPMSLGDTVWLDQDNNGTNDVSEAGISNVVVELYAAGDVLGTDTPLATEVTDTAGTYLFENLDPGDYVVYLPSTNFVAGAPLEDLISSTGNGVAPDPDDDANDDDNGDLHGVGGIVSSAVTLSVDNEPTDDGDADPNSNLSIDFGLFEPMSLGNIVWFDENNSGDLDGAEVGIDGVIVSLFAAGGSGAPTGSVLQTDTTGGGGYYLFDELVPGDYVVVVDATNFASGQVLDLHATSTGGAEEADPDSDGDSNDNGLNTTDPLVDGVPSEAVTLALGVEPGTETDFGPEGDGTSVSPTNSNLTVDFGFFIPVSVGDTIFFDENNNGTNDVSEAGISNVVVELYVAGDTPGTDTPLAIDTTDINGSYLFEGLNPGDYVVYVPSVNFDPGAPLETYNNSTGNGVAPDPDDDANDDDNGEPDGSGGVVAQAVSLASNGEPTDDGDTNPNSNLSVDIGFYQPMSLGDTVWFDENNNGTNDVIEVGISNVVVELYADSDTPGTDAPLAMDTTDGSGTYLFEDLVPGDYVVYVPSTNFVVGAPLEELLSSTGNGVAPDPDDDVSDDDNGDPDGSGGLVSQAVTLSVDGEPTDDGDMDPNSNLSVDFGLYKPMSLGNIVWFDENNSGDLDGAEVGIDGVAVSLFTAGTSGAPTGSVLQTDTTGGGGYYLFDDLVPGEYVVVVDAANFATGQVLELHATSTGASEEADPDSDGDSNDNGLNTTDPLVTGVPSAAVMLSVDGEPPSETDLGPEGDGVAVTAENSNLTVDFGFFIPVSVGDTIFFDENNNGTNDVGETGISNVVVELYVAGDTPGTDTPLAIDTTDINGSYLFEGLNPGDYVVYVPSVNFDPGAPLETYNNSTGNGVAPDPDDDANDDDNGEPDGSGGVVAQAVSLASNGEPTDDGDTNPNSNLSVDIGFYQPMSLGDTVWFDENNNGTNDVIEVGISNVVVELYADSDTPGTDAPLAMDTTDGSGTYLFEDLVPGDYVVYVPSTNFVVGAPLEELLSSTGNGVAPDPDDDVSDDDNGDPDGSGGLVSQAVTLSVDGEPTDDGDMDPNSNLSVDFGLYKPMSLGNLVWFDENNSGDLDGAEVGIDGVAVSLFTAGTSGAPTGSVLQTDTTGGGGYYLFDDLVPGEYVVVVDAANFATGQVLELHATSTGASEEADPDSDGDSNDNGLNTTDPLVTGVPSAAVMLSVDGEPPSETDLGPEGDGVAVTAENSNLTVDFGFFIPVSVGDTIFFDENNNGTNDVGETGISNVVVELYVAGDTPGTDTPLATDTTDINGNYLFEGLNPGDYVVYVPSVNFDPGAPLETYNNSTGNGVAPDPDDDANDDDNGEPDGSGGVVAQVVSLASNGEPTDDGDTNPNSNLSVDIGFYQPIVLGGDVWFDENNNGTNDVSEIGVSNVVVELYVDGDMPGVDTPHGSDTTDTNGTYLLEDLVPGDYVVYVPPTNFVADAPLEDLLSSTGNGTAPDPDDDVDHDDNADGDGILGLMSQAVTLSVDGEPTDDGDMDPNSNFSIDVGVYKPMSLGNIVWFDENNSGDLDGAEVGIDGVAVSLFTAGISGAPTGSVLQTDVTAGGGYYLFDDLVPGDYVVVVDATNFASGQVLDLHATSTGVAEEVDPDSDGDNNDNGLNMTDPLVAGVASEAVTLLVDGEPLGETDIGPEGDGVAVTPENSNLTVDFGFFIPVSVGDSIFFDENNNGTNDVGEAGISNVVVELYAAGATPGTDTPLATELTGVNGDYLFEGLNPGDYIVYVPSMNFDPGAPLETYNNSTGNGVAPDPDDDANDDDNGEPDGSGGVVAQAVSLASNGEPIDDGDTNPNSNLSVDIGFYQPMSLGNRLWLDSNNDGLDSEEPGISGVLVILLDHMSIVVTNTITDANGYYLFDDLVPGDYQVQIDASNFQTGGVLEGFSSTEDGAGDMDLDDNGPGVSDTSGPSVSGITSPIMSLIVDMAPTGETVGVQGTGMADDANSDLTIDFGFYVPMSLGNVVWLDANHDGVLDIGEVLLDGVVVNLLDGTGSFITNATTSGGGAYLFDDLLPGNYIVQLDASNFLPGELLEGRLSSTGSTTGVDGADTGVDVLDPSATGVSSPVIALTAGGQPTGESGSSGVALDINSDLTVDFGVYQPMSLGNLVWSDANTDGIRDAGEMPIPGVIVNLLDSLGSFVGTSVTDAGGYYLFNNLTSGTYTVQVALENFQSGGVLEGQYNSTGSSTGVDGQDTGLGVDPVINLAPTPAAVQGAAITLSVDGAPVGESDLGPAGTGLADDRNSDLTQDFGFYMPASIGDLVWEDVNFNGVQDLGEAGLEGVRVNLLDVMGATSATVTTAPSGMYHFGQVVPGDYSLQFVPPIGYQLTMQDVGSDNLDSDMNPADGTTVLTTLDPGENDPNWDAGMYLPASIGDYVWDDVNADGLQDTGETGLVAIVVHLYVDENGDGVADPNGDDGAPVASVMTDTNGFYEFDGLDPDDYFVEVVVPTNKQVSLTSQGEDGAVDSDVVSGQPIAPTNAVSFVVELSSGEEEDTVDVGLYEAVTIGNFVWHDANGDGVLNEDLAALGINDVEVLLYREEGENFVLVTNTTTATSSTGEEGFYIFSGLAAGNYAVIVNRETLPIGLEQPTTPGAYGDELTPGEINLNGIFGFIFGVTAVELIDFSAEATGDGILVRWRTGEELAHFGFHVYHFERGSDDRVQVNRELVLASPDGQGQEYELLDWDVEPGVEYIYWLEDIDRSFVSTMHGPVVATFVSENVSGHRSLGDDMHVYRISGVDRNSSLMVRGQPVPTGYLVEGGDVNVVALLSSSDVENLIVSNEQVPVRVGC